MSFYAYTDISHSEESLIKASDINTPTERSADYYCPGCNCIFRYRAKSSNGRAAHFYKHPGIEHDENCWMKDFSDKDEPKEFKEYDWKGFSAREFLNSIQDAAIRTGRGFSSSASVGATGTVQKIKATTIRQLYRICCDNPDTTQFLDGSTIRDILCSRKTAYFYRYFCRGIKIIEARYYWYDDKGDRNYIYFKYPYSPDKNQKPNFIAGIIIEDEKMYKSIQNMAYECNRPILIFADWKHPVKENMHADVYANILNKHQVVPLP